jgi:hypothetical protein
MYERMQLLMCTLCFCCVYSTTEPEQYLSCPRKRRGSRNSDTTVHLREYSSDTRRSRSVTLAVFCDTAISRQTYTRTKRTRLPAEYTLPGCMPVLPACELNPSNIHNREGASCAFVPLSTFMHVLLAFVGRTRTCICAHKQTRHYASLQSSPLCSEPLPRPWE